MKVKRFLFFFVLFALYSLPGQAQVSQMSAGKTLPDSCIATVDNVFYKVGDGWYRCSAQDTWTIVAGSAIRPVRSKSGRDFNVLRYGAAGDGSRDDAKAFTAAIRAARRAGSGTIYAPGGTYLIGSKLTFPPGVSFRGAGMDLTVLKRKSTYAGDLIWTGPGSGARYNASIGAFTIDGNYPARTGGAGVEIRITGPGTTIYRLRTINPGYQAISADHGSDSQILDSVITGNGSPTTGGSAMGIWADNHKIENLIIARNRITNWTVNGVFGGATGLIIDSNYFAGNHVQTSPVGGGQIAMNDRLGSMTVVNNYLGPGGGPATEGLEIDNAPWFVFYNPIVDQGAHGILLAGGTGHVLIGNRVSGSGIGDFSSAISVMAWRGWANSPTSANNVPHTDLSSVSFFCFGTGGFAQKVIRSLGATKKLCCCNISQVGKGGMPPLLPFFSLSKTKEQGHATLPDLEVAKPALTGNRLFVQRGPAN